MGAEVLEHLCRGDNQVTMWPPTSSSTRGVAAQMLARGCSLQHLVGLQGLARSYPTLSRTSAAARMQPRSESDPMMTPTRGAGGGASPSPCRLSSAAAAAAADSAITLRWPILRRGLGGDLPYQCTLVGVRVRG